MARKPIAEQRHMPSEIEQAIQYITTSHSVALMFEEAVTAQYHQNILSQAITVRSISDIYKGDSSTEEGTPEDILNKIKDKFKIK